MFQRYVASVLDGCCKSRSGCCIRCTCCTLMFQTFVPNVPSIFSDVCSNHVYLGVVYVSHICCMCFILDVAYVLQWFSSVSCVLSVSDACFKRFICLHTYVASVVSGCFKSRSGVAPLSSSSAASPWCLLFSMLVMFGRCGGGRRGWGAESSCLVLVN